MLNEIDIVGYKDSKIFLNAQNVLVVECKKQSDPWIFFNQKEKNPRIFTLNVNFAGFYDGYVDYSKDNESIFKKHFYHNRECCTYFLVGGKHSEKGGPGATIDRAIYQAHNAVKFYLKQGRNEYPIFYYPIIVFDGEIFEASYRVESLEIKKSNHVSLYFEEEYNAPQYLETVKSMFF